jgi:peptide/nickel transport system ATP-binding protein
VSDPDVTQSQARAPEVRVDVQGLQVCLAGSGINVIDDVSFRLASGELLGLVGESGSGKTTLALTVLGYTRRGLRIAGGAILLGTVDVLTASQRQLQRLRGADVAYVPQDPTSALNPALRVGTQLLEVLRAHPDEAAAFGDPHVRVAESLEEAGLSEIPNLLRLYPHQLSGGQQQRVGIAMAFLLRPKVIVLDEPTTGLDVTTQRHVLDTVRRLCRSHGVAAIYVSHDLAVVGGLVDTMVVLYAGKVMESGPTAEVFGSPAHPYTKKLLRAVPLLDRPEALEGIPGQPPRLTRRPLGCQFAPRCDLAIKKCTEGPIPLVAVGPGRVARCIRTDITLQRGEMQASKGAIPVPEANGPLLRISGLSARYGAREVLREVDVAVERNEVVAVVGESGSGKTTLARCLVGLHGSWEGEIRMGGIILPRISRNRSPQVLQDIQYIFQNPYTALNPRKTVGRIIERPLAQFYPSLTRAQRDSRVSTALSDVSLAQDFWARYPDQLSGGERQRVAIARALIVNPQLLVCDEITSALDVSVQATIIELLRRLQRERGLSMIFITHNLALVRSIAQQVVVLSKGEVVETGSVSKIFERPEHRYTIQLMEDAPRPNDREISSDTVA